MPNKKTFINQKNKKKEQKNNKKDCDEILISQLYFADLKQMTPDE